MMRPTTSRRPVARTHLLRLVVVPHLASRAMEELRGREIVRRCEYGHKIVDASMRPREPLRQSLCAPQQRLEVGGRTWA